MNKGIALVITSGLLITVLGLGVMGYQVAHDVVDPSSDKVTIITVARGSKPSEIIKKLEQEKIIRNSERFFWVGRVLGYWGRLKAGEYQVTPRMSSMDILGVLTSGISVMRILTIPEGDNMYQVAEKIEAKGLATAKQVLSLCKSPQFMRQLGFKDPLPATLEGYLYPNTYFFNREVSLEQLLSQMVKTFRSKWEPSFDKRAQELGLTPYEILVLASMIEKETGAPSERPMISSVFYNRFAKKMRLQSDPTTIYGMWESYTGNIHKSDLLRPSPYNTYTIPKLPIGPIANPGIEAIKAALYPAQSEFLFFVSHNDGTHEFTKSLKDHQNAVNKFQVDAKAREGKSWRDLKK